MTFTRDIASTANPLIKVFRNALKEGSTREGWLAVEGPVLVREALRAAAQGGRGPRVGCVVHSILMASEAKEKYAGLLAQAPAGTEIAAAPEAIFNRLSATAAPQGIAALVEARPPDLRTVLSIENVLVIAAFGLQDPGNLGTILRSAESLGAGALVTLKSTVHPSNPKIIRASGGALFRLPVFSSLDPEFFFAQVREARVRLLATDSHSGNSVASADLTGSVAFLIGNEGAGLPASISPAGTLAIPLRPGVDSLNAAVAAGILLYEAARQRGFHYRQPPSE